MRTTLPVFTMLLVGLCLFAHPHDADTANAVSGSGSATVITDSSGLKKTSLATSQDDAAHGLKTPDTVRSGAVVPVVAVQPQAKRKINLIKRTYNSRQQKILAVGMMAFVIGIYTMAQQWNPK